MRHSREFGVRQKSAWFALHHLRKAAENRQDMFPGPVEVDSSCMGREEAQEACEQDAQRGGEA